MQEELRINNIAVRDRARGCGIGAALLRHVLDRGRLEHCTEAELEVRPSSHVARRLYQRHGFSEVRRRKGY